VKPVVWSNPFAAAGVAVTLGWLASIEIGSSRTASRKAARDGHPGELIVDTATSRVFEAAALVSLISGVGASLLSPHTTIRARRTAFGAGMALLAASGALSSTARRHLGRFHRDALTVHDDQLLVDTGPYHYVRHPLYAATIGVFAGTGAVLGNWVSVAAAGIPAGALAHRIAVEERMLLDHLGHRYSSYRQRTSRLLPGVW
jgi:protein-S-isoprenylcysteine O-methyltransferase Ste14